MEENEVQGSDDEGIKKRRGNCGDGDNRMLMHISMNRKTAPNFYRVYHMIWSLDEIRG